MGISIRLDRHEYVAGDEITATVVVDLEKPVKARGIYASLVCTEKEKKKITRHMPQAEIEERRRLGLYTEVPFTYEERVEDHVTHREERKVAGSGTFQKGEYVAKFRIPGTARPTSRVFGHDNRITAWHLNAKLDIPLALDVNAHEEVVVGGLE